MSRRNLSCRIVGLFSLVFALTLPQAAGAQKLIVGWSAVSALNSPYWVMKDGGFLKQEGLEADLIDGSLQYAYDFVEKIPLVKQAAFQVTLDEIGKKNPKARQAKPEQFYDNGLVQELVKEGFFASLWGKSP